MENQGLQNIDSLINKIHQEGVDKANKDADDILNKAESIARKKVEEAEQKASAIIEKAKEEADQLRQHTMSEMQVASSKLIDNLHQQISGLFQEKLLSDLKALDQKDHLFDLLQKIIAKWEPSAIQSISTGPADYADLTKSLKKTLPGLVDKTISSQEIKPGVTLIKLKEGFQLEISKETLINELKPYLSTGIQETLFKSG